MNSLIRSRWAAIGAAVAVTLGAGGLISVNAANDRSSLVPITPARILDTRSGDRVGSLDTAGASDPYRLKVVGTDGIPTSGVTGVSLNVTAVDTQTNNYGGYVSVYPCAAVSSAKPDVSNMNFGSGQTIANAVTVPVSTDGHICLYVYGTAHLLVDANGYYTQAGSGEVDAYTKSETDAKLANKADELAVESLETMVSTKAEQSTVDSVEAAVEAKADQTAVDTLETEKADVAELRVVLAGMQTPNSLDTTADVGTHTSIAISNTGFPIVSYYDTTNTALKVAACTTAGCTGTPVITMVDNSASVGRYASIAIGDNGFPVISYYDASTGDLKVAACTNVICTSTPTITTVDASANVGLYTSIAIGSNGFPVISYIDDQFLRLKVAACTTTDCTGVSTITTLDSANDNSGYTAIAIGHNGFPVIAYLEDHDLELKVAACTTTDCTGTPTITTIDTDGRVGNYASIAIRDDGNPIISYMNMTNENLKVAACTTIDCTGTPTITTLDSTGWVGYHTSIAINDEGYPVISYFDATNGDLKVAVCSTTNCSGTPTLTAVDVIGNVGEYTSISIGSSGIPVISYHDSTNNSLKVVPMWSHLFGD